MVKKADFTKLMDVFIEGCDALGITHEVKQSLLALFEKNRSLMCEQEMEENSNEEQ